jgi:hypothetical protein
LGDANRLLPRGHDRLLYAAFDPGVGAEDVLFDVAAPDPALTVEARARSCSTDSPPSQAFHGG